MNELVNRHSQIKIKTLEFQLSITHASDQSVDSKILKLTNRKALMFSALIALPGSQKY